jgi:5-methylcytosine-specific restriction endonuclease McrA
MPSPRKRPGRKRRPSRRRSPQQDTSVSTSRGAYADTRAWLLASHGPICAYCGHKYTPRSLTLDHVTPRKGQSAYDRRDNLVLACKRCNTAKADKPFLVYLLAQRSRAERLLRYGTHLSEGILNILRHMVGDAAVIEDPPANRKPRKSAHELFGPVEESPYLDHDSPYRKSS